MATPTLASHPLALEEQLVSHSRSGRPRGGIGRAFDELHPALIYLRRDPVAGLRGHPRIERIAQAKKLPD